MAVTHSTTAVGTDSGSGEIHRAEWNANHTVADGSFVAAKLSASATDVVFGRSTSGAGNGEEIAVTAAGRALIDDADAAAQRTTLGIATAITGTKIDDLTAGDDNTDLNATTGHHGLLPKLDGTATHFLDGTGAWSTPSGSTVFIGAKAYNSTTQTINNTNAVLVLDSEEFDSNSFHFTSAAALTGTVAKTNGSADIVGTGTSFTTELSVNQLITIPGTATEIGVVKVITDNTHLTLWQTMANSASGQTATRKNSGMAVPAGYGGKYDLTGGGFWSGSGSWLGFKVNGSNIRGFSTGTSYAQIGTTAALNEGDYVEMWGNSTGNVTLGHASLLDAQTWMCMKFSGA